MILDFAKNRGPARFILITICIAAFFCKKILLPLQLEIQQTYMPLAKLTNDFIDQNTIFSSIIKFLILFVCSYVFIIILSKYDALPQRKYFAAILFLAIISIFTTAQNLASTLISILFQLLAILQIFRIHKKEKAKSPIFISAFYVGLATFFMIQSAVIIICIIFGIWIFSIITAKHILSLIAGILTPALFILCYFHLIKHNAGYFFELTKNNLIGCTNIYPEEWENVQIYFIYLLIFISTISMYKIFTSHNTKTIIQKVNYIFCIHTIIVTIVAFIAPATNLCAFALLSIPIGYIATRYTQVAKIKWFSEFITLSVIVFAIVYNNFIL